MSNGELNRTESKRQVGINMIANIVSFSVGMLISFVLTPFLIRTLGKEVYGFYPIANNIVSYLSVVTSAMSSMASRFVTVSLVQNNRRDANRYFSSAAAANTILSVIVAIPMLIIVLFVDSFMDVPFDSVIAVKELFALVFASVLVNILSAVFGIATFAKNRIDLRSLRELIAAILKAVLFVVLYAVFKPSVVYIGTVALIIALLNMAVQVFYTKKLMPEVRFSISNVSWSCTKALMAPSVWTMVNSLGNLMLTTTSVIMANMFYGAQASGSYSIVQTVPQFINTLIGVLAGVFYPVITYRYAENDHPGLLRELRTSQQMMGGFTCAVIAVFSALGTDFFSLWTPGEDAAFLSRLSFVVILPHYLIACLWSLTNLNIAMNKVRVPALFTLGCGVANILFSYVLYKFSDIGVLSLAIVSTVLQYVWIGILIPQYVCRKLGVRWYTFYVPVWKGLGCAALVFTLIYIIKSYFNLNSWFRLLLFGAISGACALALFMVVMVGFSTLRKQAARIIKR